MLPCEPVSCGFEPILWRYNTDIENWRPERGARNSGERQRFMNVGDGEWSLLRRRSDRTETRGRLLNLEIYRRCFSHGSLRSHTRGAALIERAQSRALDRRHVDEYVFAACLRLINPWPLVGLNHFTVPRTISISQVTIRGDVIQIGDLVARRWRPRHQALPGRPASALN
jgi:hypothetical protein